MNTAKIFKWAAIGAIINLAILILSFILSFLLASQENNTFILMVSLSILLISIIAGLFILWGYFKLAKALRLKFLKIMVIISFAFVIIISLLELALAVMMGEAALTALSLVIMIFSLVELIFGISVFTLNQKFKGLAIALGICYIIFGTIRMAQGLFFIAGFLSIIGLIAGISISVLEAIIFFMAAKSFQDILSKAHPTKKIIKK